MRGSACCCPFGTETTQTGDLIFLVVCRLESTISGPKERYTFGNEPFYVCTDFLN